MTDFWNGGFGCSREDAAEGMRLRFYDAGNGGGGESKRSTSLGIWRRWKRWEKLVAQGQLYVRDCACLPILISPFFFSLISCGVRSKSTMKLQVLERICTELPLTLTMVTGRSSSVRHHGTSSILGVNKKLAWTKMWMGYLNASLVFGSIMSALEQEWRAEVEH